MPEDNVELTPQSDCLDLSFFLYNTFYSADGNVKEKQHRKINISIDLNIKQLLNGELITRGLLRMMGFKKKHANHRKKLDKKLKAYRENVYEFLDVERTFETIRFYNSQEAIDVLGLCEVLHSQREEYKNFLKSLGFEHVFFGAGHTARGIQEKIGVVLATRRPSKKIKIADQFAWPNIIGGGGGVVLVHIEGTNIYVLHIHLATFWEKTINSQIQALKKILRQLPSDSHIVLQGDFNMNYPTLIAKLGYADDVLIDCIGHTNTKTFKRNFDTDRKRKQGPIDLVTAKTRNQLNVLRSSIGTTGCSDHHSVQTTLRFFNFSRKN